MTEPIKIKFPFGAIKEIEEKIGVDLLIPAEKREKDYSEEHISEFAEIGVKWGNRGMSEQDIKENALWVTYAEVFQAMQEAFGGNLAVPNRE